MKYNSRIVIKTQMPTRIESQEHGIMQTYYHVHANQTCKESQNHIVTQNHIITSSHNGKITEGSVKVKIATIGQMEKQRWEEAEKRRE